MDLKEKKQNLIKHLIGEGHLKTESVISAFKEVKRELFVPGKYKDHAYADEPLPIGAGQTISAPHMVAMMTELLEPKKSDKVLEVGAGSGYQAAILSKLVKVVYAVEIVPNLVHFAEENLKKTGCKNVEVIQGDGSKGYKPKAPYDKVIITCGTPDIPEPLIQQLKEGGRLVAPVGGTWYQNLILGIKKKGKLEKQNYGGCVFVPMRH